jgi:response regulator NasT
MLSALDGFRIVAEAGDEESAIESARHHRPHLALIELELCGCGGWWTVQRIQAEQLADVVVALGRRASDTLAHLAGAHAYVEMGASPRDLLTTLEAALAFRSPPVSGVAQAQGNLLPNANPVLDEPTLVDF